MDRLLVGPSDGARRDGAAAVQGMGGGVGLVCGGSVACWEGEGQVERPWGAGGSVEMKGRGGFREVRGWWRRRFGRGGFALR